MPVSKRDKKVSLTKTTKKGMATKQKLVENIRKFLDEYKHLYVFTINNMRNGPLKNLREEWKDSRFFFAKRKVMAIALGRTQDNELQTNIHKVAGYLVGQCGMLFTNRPKDQVLQFFQTYSEMEYAKSGFAATETVVLPKGPLPEFSFSLEPHLRSLGMPTQLEKGVIILREDFTVCTQGSKLTPEQASILKLIGNKMAEFKIKIVCVWSKDGSFERFKVLKKEKQLPKASTPDNQNSSVVVKERKRKKNVESVKAVKSEPVAVSPEKNNPEEEKERKRKKNVESVKAVKSEPVAVSPKKNNLEEENNSYKNPVRSKKKVSAIKEESEETLNEEMTKAEKYKPVITTPEITRERPRRSMRTPKPLRKSPEEKTQSVKKLTESSKKVNSAVKEKVARAPRGTPRKSVSKKIFEESEDVEMAE